MTNHWKDIKHADVVLVMGANPAENHPCGFKWALEARDERVIHWVAGLSFLFLLMTGLAFSHPRLFWITNLVGGGSTARFLHPWMGILFTGSMAVMFLMWAKEMGIQDHDRAWLKSIKHYAVHAKNKVPDAGKYNGGQKLFFWSMAVFGIAYLATGIPMWMPGGVLGMGPFYGGVVNAMRLVHYLTTVFGGLLLIVHVYLGTIAYPGTLGRMLHGSVSRAWAKLHHPLWQKEQSGP